MLVLTRTLGQEIRLGDEITITVLEIRGGSQVKLGLTAPSDIKILRAELVGREPAR